MFRPIRRAPLSAYEFAPGFPVSFGIYPPYIFSLFPTLPSQKFLDSFRGYPIPESRTVESNVIRILGGTEKILFVVHEGLLRYCSEIFHAALKGDFKEAKDRTFELDEEDPETFKLFVHYVYFGQIHENDTKLWNTGEDPEDREDIYTQLCRLWIFSDRRGISELQGYVISCLYRFKGFDSVSHYCEAANLAYDETPKGSKLQRLVIYHSAMTTTKYREKFDAPNGTWPRDFLADIIHEFATTASGRSVYAMEQSMKAEFHDIGCALQSIVSTNLCGHAAFTTE